MIKVEPKGLDYEGKRSPGGLNYSAILKNKRFKATHFLIRAHQEKQLFTLSKVFLRSLQLAWCMPLQFILKKKPFWEKFVFFRLNNWGKAICKIVKVRLHIINRENVLKNKTYLFASNHLSLLDVPVLAAAIPVKNKFIANKELTSFYVTKLLITFGASLMIDNTERKGQIKALKDIRQSLLEGNNLIIFPESSMSYDGKLQRFQRGGLSAAVFANVPILPVYIKGTREVCPPGAFSFKFDRDVHVIFGKAIDCENLNREDKKNINTIVYNELKKLSDGLTHKI
jgi:1-acyl-sn-glycerol-3-phosphate acyltransferase